MYFLWFKQFKEKRCNFEKTFYLKEKNKIPPFDSADNSFI